MKEREPTPLDALRTLVIDSAWRPIRAIGWERAMTLDLGDRVEVLEYYDRMVHTATAAFPLPAVVRARKYVSKHPARVNVSRRNVMIRDGSCCQYCGARSPSSGLTLDHVVPRSRGGASSWDNLVACCATCNRKKADRTPAEAKMPLIARPRVPDAVELGRDGLSLTAPPPEWVGYLRKR